MDDSISVFKIGEDGLFECTHTLQIKKVLQFATGGIVVDHQGDLNPVVCGGKQRGSQTPNMKCNSLSKSATHNTDVFSLSIIGATSLVIDNGDTLWIAGGNTADKTTTEFIAAKGKCVDSIFQLDGYGPMLPGPQTWPEHNNLHFPCFERLGETTAILVGGLHSDGWFDRESWTIVIDDMVWNPAPLLQTGRGKHSCGVLRLRDQSMADKKIVIAAGGETTKESVTRTVEYVIFEEDGDEMVFSGVEWSIGPNLPKALAHASSITTADQSRLFVIGGIVTSDSNQGSFSVFQMQCSDLQCYWSKLDQELRKVSAMGLAFMLPISPLPSRGIPTCAGESSKGKHNKI